MAALEVSDNIDVTVNNSTCTWHTRQIMLMVKMVVPGGTYSILRKFSAALTQLISKL